MSYYLAVFQTESKQIQANLGSTNLNPPNLQLSKSALLPSCSHDKTTSMVMSYMFNIINNGDLDAPATLSCTFKHPQPHLQTCTPAWRRLPAQPQGSKALCQMGLFTWRYQGSPTQSALVTAKGGSVDCDPHIHWLLLQSLPRLLGWG